MWSQNVGPQCNLSHLFRVQTTLKSVQIVVFIHSLSLLLLIQTCVSKEFYLARPQVVLEFLRKD